MKNNTNNKKKKETEFFFTSDHQKIQLKNERKYLQNIYLIND